jgi:carbon storage regulator
MLVLSRKIGERIVLPQFDIEVTVLGITGNKIRVGISAPDTIDVYRAEVWDQIVEKEVKSAPKG